MSSGSSMTRPMRAAHGAFCVALLDAMLPALREAARQDGYALAVHGSLSRDIDLVAVPWTSRAAAPGWFVEHFVAVAKEHAGGACLAGPPGHKPHGRTAYTVVLADSIPFIDLSVMPLAGPTAGGER
jgi:hypothetical protein